MPRVSVVIPAYNRAHLICQTLESVLAQTYRDFEVIVVDDGSTDDTLAVLSAYGDRIGIIRQSNRGLSSARNTGIREATGEFVAFLDSDDLWLPTKLEHQMALLDANPGLPWVYTDAEAFDGETGRTLYLYSRFTRLYQGDVLHHLILGDFIPTPTPVVRRAVFCEVGEFYDNKCVAEDWDMWLRIAARYQIGLVAEPLARYRVHSEMKSLSRSWTTQYGRCMNTIERAVARDPECLAPLRNRAIARLCIGTGRTLARNGNRVEAREMFRRAIWLVPGTTEAYLYWLGCLAGQRTLNTAGRLRRWLRYKRSVGWVVTRPNEDRVNHSALAPRPKIRTAIMLPRVLHVGPLPPPLGGVAVALQMILRCPALQDFDNRVFNVSDGHLTVVAERKRLTVERVVRRIRLAINVARHVRRERPDIVHLHCGSESAWDVIGYLLVMWASSITGSRIILHLHVDPAAADLPGRKRFGQWLFRQLTRPAHAIFALTEGYRKYLLSCSVHQPVQVVPNMCDETLLNLSVDRPRMPGLVHVILLGRLSRPKGIFDLLEIAAQLRTESPQIRFEVAGLPSTPDEERLIGEFFEREHLHETVALLGLVTDTDKLRLFERGDILVAPSHSESFGIVAIEAMAAGLPVVGMKVAGLSSIIVHGETGYLVESGDVESMMQHLIRLVKDRDLRERLGYAGRQRFLEHYSAQRVGAVIAGTYREVLARGEND